MSRSAATMSRSRRTGSDSPSGTVCTLSPVTTTAVSLPSTARCATRQASVAASSLWTCSSAAGSPTWPPPSPYQLCSRMGPQLVQAPVVGRVGGRVGGVQHPQLGQLGRHLRVGRGPHRRHPGDKRAGPLGPLVGELGRLLVERQPESLHGEGPAVADQRALQVEAAEGRLPRVQVGQPGADVVSGPPVVAPGAGELRAHLAPQQPGRDGRRGVDPDVVESLAGAGQVAARDSQSGHLQGHDGGLAMLPLALELRDDAVGARHQRSPVVAAGDLGDHLDRLGSGRQPGACLAAEPARGPPGHHAGPSRVLAQQRPGKRQLALGLERTQAPGPVRRRGGLQRADRLAGAPGRGQHLGPVLLADGPRDGRERRQHLAGGVHHLQRADEVPGEQPGVAEVVLGPGAAFGRLGLPHQVQRAGEIGHGRGRRAAGEVQAAAVEERPPRPSGVSRSRPIAVENDCSAWSVSPIRCSIRARCDQISP